MLGHHVGRFQDATHACCEGLRADAGYPFVRPEIAKLEGRRVTLRSDKGARETECKIRVDGSGREYCVLTQWGDAERGQRRPARNCRFYPFAASVARRC